MLLAKPQFNSSYHPHDPARPHRRPPRSRESPAPPRNRRRLTSPRAQRCINLLARTCAMIRAVPDVYRKLHRRIFPPKPLKFDLVCGCCDRRHPRHWELDRDRPRFKHRPKGWMKPKVHS